MNETDQPHNSASTSPGQGSVGGTTSVRGGPEPSFIPSVGTIADWASIVGLLISLFTAYKVLSLSRQYLFAGRVADYKKQVARHCSQLNTQLAGQQFDPDSVATTLSLCLTVLRPLKHSGPSNISTSAKKIAKAIAKALKSPRISISNDFTVSTLRDLRTLEEEISSHIKDRKASPLP